MRLPLRATLLLLLLTPTLRAGLYWSGETLNELPSQWRGYLVDQRLLRQVAVKPMGKQEPNPARVKYEEEAAKLAKLAKERTLTADEAADLGALLVRLGDVTEALAVLRPAQREHPQHFRLVANLGTAAHLAGDLDQAALALGQAVRLAPGKFQPAEELHLKLVRQRKTEPANSQGLDDLFGIRFVGPEGKYQPGTLAPDERKKLSSDALAGAQLLGLWLPADARLLWQLGELAAAHGDVTTAAAILDGCVTEFSLRHADLREHRQLMRTAAEERQREGAKPQHEAHAVAFKPRSSRPLLNRADSAPLPAVDPKGINNLPWAVVTDTTVDTKFRATFPAYLKELDGKQVSLSGFMQPFGDDSECAAFMLIEYPVGCWYCEMPAVTGIVLVELPRDQTFTSRRGLLKATGKLMLNTTDPENFLYTLRDAQVVPAKE
jgi:hypothetical protein